MPVFISHKREDSEKGAWLHEYLRKEGVPSYIDLLELGRPGFESNEALTRRILSRLGQCTHLIAVVSGYTEHSWWVPFEIGVATEKQRRICTLNYQMIKLPEYLRIWPVLRTQAHVDEFIRRYKQDSEGQTLDGRKLYADASKAVIKSDVGFHALMKQATGQVP